MRAELHPVDFTIAARVVPRDPVGLAGRVETVAPRVAYGWRCGSRGCGRHAGKPLCTEEKTPEWGRSPFVVLGVPLRKTVREKVPHVVEQQVGVRIDRPAVKRRFTPVEVPVATIKAVRWNLRY